MAELRTVPPPSPGGTKLTLAWLAQAWTPLQFGTPRASSTGDERSHPACNHPPRHVAPAVVRCARRTGGAWPIGSAAHPGVTAIVDDPAPCPADGAVARDSPGCPGDDG